MTNIQGFSPNIQRYLNSLKNPARQNVINQIANLNPNDLEKLEMQLQQKYQPVNSQEVQPQQMDEAAFMELNGLQPQYKIGGRHRMYQNGGMSDDSPEFLEQQYQATLQAQQQAKQLSPQDMTALNGEMVNMPSNVISREQAMGFFPKAERFRIHGSDFVSTDNSPDITEQQKIQAGLEVAQPKGHYELGKHPNIEKKLEKEIVKAEKKGVKQVEKEANRIAEIKEIQKKLQERGYKNSKGKPIDIDGVFGPDTDKAVKHLQRRTLGFKAGNGIVGKETKLILGLNDKIKGTYKSTLTQVKKDLGIPQSKINAEYRDSRTNEKGELPEIIINAKKLIDTKGYTWNNTSNVKNELKTISSYEEPKKVVPKTVTKFKPSYNPERESTKIKTMFPSKSKPTDFYKLIGENELGVQYLLDTEKNIYLQRDKITGNYQEVTDSNVIKKLKQKLN